MSGFFIQCPPHGEHQWSMYLRLLPTGNCLSSYQHSQTRGPNTSMPCQFHGLGWEWCMLSHRSRCYRLHSARFIVLMICQWFSLLCNWWQHHGCQSYSSSPDVFPYHWKGMHFSYIKFECPEVTCSNAGNMIQLLTHISEQCSSIFSWTNQSNETWCHNGTFISSCQPCYDLPFLMEQSIDPAMMSLTKNGGSSKQHFSCCWLLPGGDPICMLYVCQPASSHVEMCRIGCQSLATFWFSG